MCYHRNTKIRTSTYKIVYLHSKKYTTEDWLPVSVFVGLIGHYHIPAWVCSSSRSPWCSPLSTNDTKNVSNENQKEMNYLLWIMNFLYEISVLFNELIIIWFFPLRICYKQKLHLHRTDAQGLPARVSLKVIWQAVLIENQITVCKTQTVGPT